MPRRRLDRPEHDSSADGDVISITKPLFNERLKTHTHTHTQRNHCDDMRDTSTKETIIECSQGCSDKMQIKRVSFETKLKTKNMCRDMDG